MHKLLSSLTDHPTLSISLVLLTAFLFLNLLAYRHAWAMTHFVVAVQVPAQRLHLANATRSEFVFPTIRLALQGIAVEAPERTCDPIASIYLMRFTASPEEKGSSRRGTCRTNGLLV